MTTPNIPVPNGEGAFANKKFAYMWVIAIHPYCVGYPGVTAELFFSSPEKFHELLGREMGDGESLVQCTVPMDFDDWDYIPRDY